MELLPSVLAYTKDELTQKVSLIRRMRPSGVQVDVMDGIFVPNITYAPPQEITTVLDGIPFEVHCMVQDPGTILNEWLATNAIRIILHVESQGDLRCYLKQIHAVNKESGLSINPQTPLDAIGTLGEDVDAIQIMGNMPGASGKGFLPEMYDRIREVHKRWPEKTIEVDIGVNKNTILEMAEAGATRFTATGGIFGEQDPVAAYNNLVTLVS